MLADNFPSREEIVVPTAKEIRALAHVLISALPRKNNVEVLYPIVLADARKLIAVLAWAEVWAGQCVRTVAEVASA